MWWRIALIVGLSLLVVGSITSYITFSVFIDQANAHLVKGTCSVIYCVFNRFAYQWPEDPHYRAYYNGSKPIGCPTTLSCGFDDRDPVRTFGGWVHNGSEVICIGDACNIVVEYSEWYLAFIILFVGSGTGLVAAIISYLKYRKQEREAALSPPILFTDDIID